MIGALLHALLDIGHDVFAVVVAHQDNPASSSPHAASAAEAMDKVNRGVRHVVENASAVLLQVREVLQKVELERLLSVGSEVLLGLDANQVRS